jgi:predicted HTH domain antitoxin
MTMTIDIPQKLTTRIARAALENEFKRFLAVKCYQDETLSLGLAAELAGMDKTEFEFYLSDNKIPISLLTYEDVQADRAKIAHIRQVKSKESV